MKIKGLLSCGLLTLSVLFLSAGTQAAVNPDVEKAYNMAVQGQDALDGLDVSVKEQTVSAVTNIVSAKSVDLQITGIKSSALSADITVQTDETSSRSYYRNGYYYETGKKGQKIKRKMSREELWQTINSQIYLDMTSNYLKMLYREQNADHGYTYYFAGSQDTLSEYKTKLLDQYTQELGLQIDSLQGSMTVDGSGHVTARSIQMVYTVGTDDSAETFMKKADAVFRQDGTVIVSLPDLSAYQSTDPETPPVTITPKTGTIYVTTDVNVRAAGSIDAAVIGGFESGSGVTQTGYTSDGWVQVQYNGQTGYIWGVYTSTVRPVKTTDSSGIMYATADVNVRADHSVDGAILGVLKKGGSIEITGNTDNGWTRVRYEGQTGYISSNYLSWSEPVVIEQGSVSGTVTDASYGSLTIRRSDGTVVLFNTTYAVMQLADTIESGDYVVVDYTGSGSPYTATAVYDNETHSNDTMEMYTVDGVVKSYSGGTLDLVGSDGVYRSFNLSGASVEVDGRIEPGMYLMVSWMSKNGNETKNIQAAAVS